MSCSDIGLEILSIEMIGCFEHFDLAFGQECIQFNFSDFRYEQNASRHPVVSRDARRI